MVEQLPAKAEDQRQRLRLDVAGAVQGVGFRPLVHRLAMSERLGGFVRNTAQGASLEIEGPAAALDRFLARLEAEVTAPARIDRRRKRRLAVRGERDFAILPSATTGPGSAVVLPDLATCPYCLEEVFDPANRRYGYPFTTCVHCGPRFSLIEGLPYDRIRTAMRHFTMCAACQAEYDDPSSRRFHAETSACEDCGPEIALWDAKGAVMATRQAALVAAAEALRQGRIVALKGLGGFQLLVDARNDGAVRRLRMRKQRPAKPFAVMMPTLGEAATIADISSEEQALLCSPAAPIVLLRARPQAALLAPSVAPDNPWLGIMLPSTPLHHLLLHELGFPIVATSGNRGGEPVVADENIALERLGDLADEFLVHDRQIVRAVDDSVVRVMAGRKSILRLARGYAPLPLAVPRAQAAVLAVGGQQKNAVAVAGGGQIILGPHIGDLGSGETRAAFAANIAGLTSLYGVAPERIACDTHPDYYASRFAAGQGKAVEPVPHHLAHVLAGMADNGLEGAVLGVAWDGTGYGGDGTVWGGEFLAVDGKKYRRAAHLMPFRLPGGEAAMREPRRAALGVLHAVFGEAASDMTELPPVAAFTKAERRVLATMIARDVNAPLTSSAGRLFDAVAAILGLHQKARFEGEAAMAVEFAAMGAAQAYPLATPVICGPCEKLTIDWRPMVAALVAARREGIAAQALAASFHEGLVGVIIAVAKRLGIKSVLLTGGCFQNKTLGEGAIAGLRAAGFDPFWHHRLPPNDGGLAVGQAAFAARPLTEERF